MSSWGGRKDHLFGPVAEGWTLSKSIVPVLPKNIGVICRGVHTSKGVRKSYGQHTGIDATEESCPGHAQLMSTALRRSPLGSLQATLHLKRSPQSIAYLCNLREVWGERPHKGHEGSWTHKSPEPHRRSLPPVRTSATLLWFKVVMTSFNPTPPQPLVYPTDLIMTTENDHPWQKKSQLFNSNSFYLTFRTLQEDIKQNFRILHILLFKIWKLFVW